MSQKFIIFPWRFKLSVNKLIQSSLIVLSPIGLLFGLGNVEAQAAQISIVNHSFEDTSGMQVFNEFTFGSLPGWNVYDPNNITGLNDVFPGTLQPDGSTFFNDFAPDGDRVAILFNRDNTAGLGEYGFEQTLADTLQANRSYTLQVEVGNITSGTADDGQFFNLDGFPGYRVDLLAGGQVIASDNNTLAGSIPEGEFATSTINFVTGDNPLLLNQQLGIRLVSLNVADNSTANTSAADIEIDFDNVRLDSQAVPEPATILGTLTATGISLLLKRKKSRVR